jgi:hypothetical protein
MARFIADGGHFYVVYPEGEFREVKLVLDPAQGENVLNVVIANEFGENVAFPFRLMGVDGGNRLGGQLLEMVDNPYVIVDGDNKITTG